MPLHPLALQPFIGRETELAEIASLLANPACRLLTLVGPGGIGKTRLALEAARQITVPDGVHVVLFQPLSSPDFMVSSIAETLGIQFYAGTDPKQQLLDYLRDKALLLVLDNLEHLLDGVGLFSEILAAAPNVRLLLTSRERLNLREEWVLDVGGLDCPTNESEAQIESYDAVRLFVQHAQRIKSGFTLNKESKPAIIRICQLVGGMPLAIELAAAWVRALSCEAIADEIAHNLDILETPARNVEPRHRSMRAAFEPTWNRLTEVERSVFMQLSVFRGGFTREAAEVVAGASLRMLSALVDKSLLRVGDKGRYDLHELLRQYAEEQLEQSNDLEHARAAHSTYYATWLRQQWGPLRTAEQVRTLDEIETEFENIRTAWEMLVERRDAAGLSLAVYPIWYYCDLRGRYHDARILYQQAEDALRPLIGEAVVDRAVGQLLSQRGFFYNSLGKPEEGLTLAEKGLGILEQVGTPEDIVLAYDAIILNMIRLPEYDEMRRPFTAIVQAAQRSEDSWLRGRAAYWLAMTTVSLGQIAGGPSAQQIAAEACDLAETCGDLWLRALVSGAVFGVLAMQSGNYVEALRWQKNTVKLFETLGQYVTVAQSLWSLSDVYYAMQEYALALKPLLQSLKLLVVHGTYLSQWLAVLIKIARIWRVQGKLAEALECYALVFHHSWTPPRVRGQSEQAIAELQTELPSDVFAAAQERGKQLELKAVVQDLLAGFDSPPTMQRIDQSPVELLTDPLSPRELEVLALIADSLTNREIADQLYVSISTVKKHINHIYSKLDVTDRTEAVNHARVLHLIS